MLLRTLSALSLVASLGLSSVALAEPCNVNPAGRSDRFNEGRHEPGRFENHVWRQPREARPLIWHGRYEGHRPIRFERGHGGFRRGYGNRVR